MLKAGFKLPRRERLRLLGEAFKCAGIVHRQVGQDLAIQFHSALFEPVDELVVAHPVQFGGGADADDPERAILALLLFASGVGELQAAFDRFFGGPVEFGFCEEIAAGAVSIFLRLARRLVPRFTRGMGSSFLISSYGGWR